MVENYVYDKKHHLWAKLTFNVSFLFLISKISIIFLHLALDNRNAIQKIA